VREDTGHEICGLVSAKDGKALRCQRIPNIAQDKRNRYRMDPAALVRALFEIETRAETLYAFYHSHPFGPAVPSAIDIAEANYPEAIYLIVSLSTSGVLEMRGFHLGNGESREVELEIS
jgi:proteasome lid subunit RPN8/RPN11